MFCTSQNVELTLLRCEAFREAVANLYNVTYRQNKESKYTMENVCIVPGGRTGLSRIAAVIGDVYCVSGSSRVAWMRLMRDHYTSVIPNPGLYCI